MKKAVIIFSFVLGLFNLAIAQKEANVWFFGEHAGVDFNSGTPVALAGGQTDHQEGVSSISDASGNLLFYTDGKTVWNRNHTVMPNGTGLFGDWSSTQSSIAIPAPGNPAIYYIFTADVLGGSNGFCYSTVDMSLSGGLGSVTSKNIQLVTPTSEKITAVKHANGIDFWVITHKRMTDEFYAYLVDGSGVNTTPVISNAGTTYLNSVYDAGYLKASPCGGKLAAVMHSGKNCDVLNFDSNTGVVTSDFTIPMTNFSIYDPYGVEFSADGSVLYVSVEIPAEIYQFDLNAGSSAAVIASGTLIGTSSAQEVGGLQLGPDGKIYCTLFDAPYLGVIDNPGTLGAGCNFIDNAVNLGAGKSRLGIPTFIQSFFAAGPPLAVTVATGDPLCQGGSGGWAWAQASGASTYTYTWSAGGNDSIVNFLTAGTYTVTVVGTAAPGSSICGGAGAGSSTTLVRTFTINDPPSMIVTTGSTPASCGQSNGTVNASVTNGTSPYQYSWVGVGTGDTYSNLPAGDYTVSVTDANNCTAVETVNIYTPVPLEVNTIAIQNDDCHLSAGEAYAQALNGSGGYSYEWSNSQTDSVISNLLPGNYTVTVRDSWGCTETSAVAITGAASALALSVSSTDATCGNTDGSVFVTLVNGGTSAYSYLWSNGASSPTVLNLAAGVYSLVLTDQAGCTVSASAAINNPGAPTIDLPSGSHIDVDCFGASTGSAAVIVTAGGTSPFTYSWSPIGGTSSSAFGLPAGVYVVNVTDNVGCVASSIVTITEPDAIAINLTPSTAACDNPTGSITSTVSGGTGAYTYLWENGTFTTPDISAVVTGTYTLVVTDNNGCSVTETAFVGNTLPATLSSSGLVNVACYGEMSGSASVQTTSGEGTAPFTFTWMPLGITGATQNNLGAGIYTVNVSDANGCLSVTQINITQPASPLSISIPTVVDTKCSESNGAASVIVSGGTVGYNYLWNIGVTGATIANVSAGTYDLTVTDAKGCLQTTAVTINDIGGPSILPFTVTDITCYGSFSGSATVNTSNGTLPITYLWSNGTTTNTISNVEQGQYTVVVSDANSCTASSLVTITQPAVDMVIVPQTIDATCGQNNGSITVNITGGTPLFNYSWNVGSNSNSISNLAPGSYAVTVVDALGCSRNAVIGVLAAPTGLFPSFTYEPTPVYVNTLVDFNNLSGTNIGGSDWNFGDENSGTSNSSQLFEPSHTYTELGTYCVKLKIADINSICFDSTTQCFDVIEKDSIFIPNVFTPNNDGKNDEFVIYTKGMKELSCVIYDRWGLKIYEWNSLVGGWDGRTTAGREAPAGVYYFLYTYKTQANVVKGGPGYLELIRPE